MNKKIGNNCTLLLAFAGVVLGTACMPAAAGARSGQTPQPVSTQNRTPRQDDKLRILVDKVLSYQTRPHIIDAQVQEIAQAGFNVLVPRWGGEDMNLVRQGAELAQKHQIWFMPWIRGSAYTKDPNEMMVWRDGVVGTKALYSPNSDELWEKITDWLLGHARLSTEIPAIIGAFVDFENYDTHGGYGHCYPLSYDEIILKRFAAAHRVNIPSLPHKDRYPWLKGQGLHEAFAEFQLQDWRRRCRQLRRRIDAINPDFQLAVYPVPGPLFMTEAVLKQWSTARAPLILADATTYGRPMRFVNEQASLRENRSKILDHIAYVRKLRFPFVYTSGIDPIVELADPEFHGKNADMIAAVADGYWVFYEGPTYGEEDHRATFDWFSRANRSIRQGLFNLQYQERQTPEPVDPTEIKRSGNKPVILHEGLGIGLHKALNRTGAYQAHFLKSLSPRYLAQADAVILQSAIRWIECDPSLLANLRSYVEQGGRVFITNLGWAKKSCGHQHGTVNDTPMLNIHEPPVLDTFSEIATWSTPKHASCQGRYVLDDKLIITDPQAVSSTLPANSTFTTSSPNHMVLQSGPQGHVAVKDAFGDPVCVVGTCGKGKVAFSGCFYGFWAPGRVFPFGDDHERRLFFSILDWLLEKD